MKVHASRSVCDIFSRTITTASRRRQNDAVDSFSTCSRVLKFRDSCNSMASVFTILIPQEGLSLDSYAEHSIADDICTLR